MGIDVLIPVLDRPENAQKVVDSLKAATSTENRVLFLCTPGDDAEIAACRATGEETFVCGFPAEKSDFQRKINQGYRLTEDEWFFVGADDLSFQPGWDLECLRVAEQYRVDVIGTQDLGNALVKRGGHATHFLVRRDYILTWGGTVDGTGDVLCELYDHQYCDMEFIQTAQRRGCWWFAKNAIVEHLHPAWGKAEWDDTYRKSYRDVNSDVALWMRRRNLLEKGAVI